MTNIDSLYGSIDDAMETIPEETIPEETINTDAEEPETKKKMNVGAEIFACGSAIFALVSSVYVAWKIGKWVGKKVTNGVFKLHDCVKKRSMKRKSKNLIKKMKMKTN